MSIEGKISGNTVKQMTHMGERILKKSSMMIQVGSKNKKSNIVIIK